MRPSRWELMYLLTVNDVESKFTTFIPTPFSPHGHSLEMRVAWWLWSRALSSPPDLQAPSSAADDSLVCSRLSVTAALWRTLALSRHCFIHSPSGRSGPCPSFHQLNATAPNRTLGGFWSISSYRTHLLSLNLQFFCNWISWCLLEM